MKKRKNFISDNAQLKADWDWEKNELSPNEVTQGSNQICFWKCSICGYSWKTPAYSRGSNRTGCPECAKAKRSASKMKTSARKNSFVEQYPELVAEWHPTKNEGIDIKDISAFSNIRIVWLCRTCKKEWETTVNHRTKGNTGCPICSKRKSASSKIAYHSTINNFLKNHPEIAAEWHPSKNGDSLPSDFSANSGHKAWWLCSFCGKEWETTINHRTAGENCPHCNKYQTSFQEQAIFFYVSQIYPEAENRKKIDGFEFDIFIPTKKIAIEYDGKKYHASRKSLEKDNKKDLFCKNAEIQLYRFRDNSLQDTVYAKRITCSDNNIDEGITELLDLIAKDHTIKIDSNNDRGKINLNMRQAVINNSILNLKPELTDEWNYEKNENLRPESVTANANYKVWWKCKQCGHEWEATPSHRYNGRGCPACAGNICIKGVNDLLSQNPELAKEWNYEKNHPLTPDSIAVKSNKKVNWICERGHEWKAQVCERNRGTKSTNCPYCGNKKVLEGFNDLKTTHPKIAEEWHYEKNGELLPTMITAGSHKKVWWCCEHGHEWEARVYSRTRGSGCRICYQEKQKKI